MQDPENPRKTVIVSFAEIAQALNIKKRSVRSATDGLAKKGVLKSTPCRTVTRQGAIYYFFHQVDRLTSHCVTSDGVTVYRQTVDPPTCSSNYINKNTTTCVTSDGVTSHPQPAETAPANPKIQEPAGRGGQQITLPEFIAALDFSEWPHLQPESLSSYLDKGIDQAQFILDAAKAVIDFKAQREKPIKDKHSFLFGCLKKGWVQPPEGFKSREERAIEERIKYLEEKRIRIEKLKQEELNALVDLAQANMSTDEIEKFEAEIHEEAKRKMPDGVDPPKGFLESLRIQKLKEKVRSEGDY